MQAVEVTATLEVPRGLSGFSPCGLGKNTAEAK
jgi:hypothetical protein